MPKFEVMSQTEAELKSATGKRAKLTREYLGYIDQLEPGQAGRLQVSDGETSGAVRRRLGTAAKLSGKDVVIKRTGDDIYFWIGSAGTKRRGRPRKSYASSS